MYPTAQPVPLAQLPQASTTMFTNYPETWAILKAKRARHPREDAIEEFTDWTLLGNPIEQGDGPKPVAAQVLEVPAEEVKETEEQYIKRKTDFLRHKNIACRRGAGGKWFSQGGGGDGGCAFQVTP